LLDSSLGYIYGYSGSGRHSMNIMSNNLFYL
jgi:hypothetical protein